MTSARVRYADILSALSYALDLVEGQSVGHAVRTCLISMRIAERLGLTEAEQADLYFAALLKDAGCSTNSVQIHINFGDDHGAKKAVKLIDWTKKLDCLVFGLKTVHRDKSLPERLRRMVQTLNDPEAGMVEMTRTRCDRGAQIALQLGFGTPVAEAVRSLDEHWDGFGAPFGLKGEAVPILARILGLAQTLDVLVQATGRHAGFRTIRKRSGRWFDPIVVQAALSLEHDEVFWQTMGDDARNRALELATPATVRMVGEAGIDATCDAFASIIDAKSSFTASHSQRVTQYALDMGEMLGFDDARMAVLRRAGLLHDIGKLGVPTSVLEKPGKLTDAEFGIVRSHPLNTERILSMIDGFGRVTEVAAAHHERLDGRGYHRGIPAEMLDTDMRTLAVADVFDALSAERPYRGALPMAEVFAIMEREGGAALDLDLVRLLKEKYFESGVVPKLLAA
ncbi:HD domain-containing protein [bacterium]|nr:MAG: HD domain-containing protein [bacterium]